MNEEQSDKNTADEESKPTEKTKNSKAVFERRSIVFGPGDADLLDGLVRVAVFHSWQSPNRSTVIRSLIHMASQAYAEGSVYPQMDPWALHFHANLPTELEKIKESGAKRGPRQD